MLTHVPRDPDGLLPPYKPLGSWCAAGARRRWPSQSRDRYGAAGSLVDLRTAWPPFGTDADVDAPISACRA
jgi:hypothetical protein